MSSNSRLAKFSRPLAPLLKNATPRRVVLATAILLAFVLRANEASAQAPKLGQGNGMWSAGNGSQQSPLSGNNAPASLTHSVVVFTPIIQDTFTGSSGTSIAGRPPSPTDLPGGTYTVWGSTGVNTLNGSNQVQLGADRAGAINISSAGSYFKPTVMSISAGLEVDTTAGTDIGSGAAFRGVGLGFFSSVGGTFSFSNFSGLILEPDSSLALGFAVGNVQTALVDVPWPTATLGAFSTTIPYTVSYTINTSAANGGISNVSVTNPNTAVTDTLDFTAINNYSGTNIFTPTNTTFSGFLDSSSLFNTFGFVSNFQLSQAAPPASLPTWTGAANTAWANPGNWINGVPGAVTGTTNTDTALFNSFNATNPTPIVDPGRNLQNILFDNSGGNLLSSLTLGTTTGQALLLTSGGSIQTTGTVANLQVVNAPLVLEGLGGSYTFQTGSGTSTATLNFGGGITAGASSGTTTLQLAGTNTGANSISGQIANGTSGAILALTTQGGNWVLAGADTYTGATTVTGGTLRVGNGTSGSLGATPISITGGKMVLMPGGSIGNTSISVTGTGAFSTQPGSGTLAVGTTASGAAGATLSLASGATFSMIDGAIGTFNLQQQVGFAGGPALSLNGATLNFDLSSTGADRLAVGVGSAAVSGTNTIGVTTVGPVLTIGATYPLITAPAGGLTGTFQFSGGGTSKVFVLDGSAYRLSLNNSSTVESVTVSPTNLLILDTFQGAAGASYPSHAPDINIPGGIYAFQNSASTSVSTLKGNGTAVIGPDIGAGLPISSNGTYTKPTTMTISAGLQVGTIGTDSDIWRGIGLGFYSAMSTAGGQHGYSDFFGVVLTPVGALDLVEDIGTLGNTKHLLESVPWSGVGGAAFSTSNTYTLTYTINTLTGGISGVSLSGSNANFSPINNDTNGIFTDTNTAYAGFTGSAPSTGTFGLVSNFFVAVTPNAGPSTWTGGAGNSNWADGNNWLNNTVPGATSGTASTDTATFSLAATSSPTLIDTNRNVKNITFDTAAVSSMTVGTTTGNPLLLTAGGVAQTTSTVTNPQTINAPLVLEGNYSLTSGATSSAATLTVGGRVSPAATSGITTLSLNGSNSGANTISGALADNAGGKLAILANGSGQWILSGLNSYSGGTTISSGKLKLVTGGTNNIPQSSLIDVAAGATLDVTGVTGTGGFALASGQTLEGKGIIAGGVTVAGGSHLDPGESVGTLTGDALTLLPGSLLDFEFNGTSNDFFNALGNNGLLINGGGFNLLAEGTSNPFSTVGTYHLLGYSGTLQGTGIGALSVLDPQPGLLYTFSNNLAGHEIDLRIAPVPEPSGLALAALAGLAFGGLTLARERVRIVVRSVRIGRLQTASRWHIVGRAGRTLAVFLAALAVTLMSCNRLTAQTNGVWKATASGSAAGTNLWSTGSNWQGSNIADGSGAIADFSQITLTTNETAHLNSPRTIGNLVFGDVGNTFGWTLDNNTNSANVLTLAVPSGTPSITVNNQMATIAARL